MSRTVLWFVVAGAVVIAAAVAVAWHGKLSEQAVLQQGAKSGATTSPAPTPPTSPPVAAAPLTVPVPTFDVARIGPDGRAVIAGRAEPGAKIVLLDGGKEIAKGQADANGEWVILAQEPPLAPGEHELRVLQHIEGRAPITSDQVVVAIVPAQPGASAGAKSEGPREETLVMIAPPGGAPTLVQPPSAAGVPKSGDLVMSTLDYDESGHVTITGKATPGTVVRAYIDDKIVAEGKAGTDGHWRLAPGDAIPPGKYKLRLDRLAKDGKPVARLELPFERIPVAPGTGETRRLVVVRGDNLWNIARAQYGHGMHHTLIYGANKDQIRNPDLIYPGQVFSLPKVN